MPPMPADRLSGLIIHDRLEELFELFVDSMPDPQLVPDLAIASDTDPLMSACRFTELLVEEDLLPATPNGPTSDFEWKQAIRSGQ
jgi:hypothetical protein